MIFLHSLKADFPIEITDEGIEIFRGCSGRQIKGPLLPVLNHYPHLQVARHLRACLHGLDQRTAEAFFLQDAHRFYGCPCR